MCSSDRLSIMKEHKSVQDAVKGLTTNDFALFARSVNKSHDNMRDLYAISCPEIDWLVKRVLEFDSAASGRNPTAASRITGKGFARCTYTIIKNSDVPVYAQKIAEYERIFGFHPSFYTVKPVGGAHIMEEYKK